MKRSKWTTLSTRRRTAFIPSATSSAGCGTARGTTPSWKYSWPKGKSSPPELYSEVLSIREFGVFGSQDGDGTYSVTIIPWTTVRKIGIRKLPELSDKVFR